MNLPNKITIARICLIPLFMLFLLVDLPFGELEMFNDTIAVSLLIAALIFVIAAGTDWLDGYYARKLNLITSFGKFIDPLADKLLVTAALIGLVEIQLIPAWIAIVIISREFIVTGIRLVAAAEGDVIAASNLGKWKTLTQMVAIIATLLHNIPFSAISFPFADLMLYVAAILTIWSGVDYFVKNKHIILKSV
ncbi:MULTISPECIES: CDP-diacylglycerol--glycerol-3-phosphate 3-phosphatidyltransferase [Shouchella]|uniref:CDP-diacylglycerol--glycerol-3-phosphate 3-phosphatidyltransferase n=4 Tax=Bacillaceae TaxID=186817 RepID=A0A060M2I5_9BACI|nr:MULTISPECIES: CDP-diacylglycerol--glycerol-3-phosphate 3-phosphatidyltransferase [Bacillaceae]RQW20617.1 CDP-diacylglycerol--glycerol-3-phosphate 3-phosphatidyltransferase [Bacillus sp. C1-1]GAF23549.1 CDP-diacylglycerol--glycerol-3-phosphate 3-phosphatidyltransferase [Bacillus sp. JCM 19047]AIC94768.1 CDP-diacylglycerol--glycerol-3-phosphate 3-phosphatidyltransferase [Shouchella lehensis G1]KQL51700.1 CDP-diacylglycerol--glycerol-3-phosphate 3-phosphatidyltransferase [Alkalicoccobacillus pl